jgi:opacity protein-like surface antigen
MYRVGLGAMALVAALPSAALAGEWSGFYVGAHAGYVQANVAYHPDTWTWYDRDANGAKIGLLAGFNWDLGAWVLGAEGDVSFLNLSTDSFGPIVKFELETQSSLRARLGFDGGNALYYVTGGVAFIDGHTAWAATSGDASHTGYTIGGGVEFAVSEMFNVRGEYLYADFDQETYQTAIGGDLVDPDLHAIRGALILHW